MKRLVLCWWLLCAVHLPVTAHQLDQYLQVAQLALAPDGVRVELRLIPGVEIAPCVFALIDADGDGWLSAAEAASYAQQVLQDLALTINDRRVALTLIDQTFPEPAAISALSEGLGTIRLTFNAAHTLTEGEPQRLNFRNDHFSAGSVYLVNALVPESKSLTITGQQRDVLQRGLQLNFHLTASNASWRKFAGLSLAGLAFCLLIWKSIGLLRSSLIQARSKALT